MGSEKQTWRNLKKGFDQIKGTHYQRIEDALSCGIPDLMLCYKGVLFIELKHLDAFPKREATPVRLGYRRNQWIWAKNHVHAGGRCFLLAQVGKEYFVFDDIGIMFDLCEERYNAAEFRILARAVFPNGIAAANYLIERAQS